MDTDRKWIIVRIDGKIASISTDYQALADISARLAGTVRKSDRKNLHDINEISVKTVCFEEVWRLRDTVKWEDLILFGTDFQKKVWQKIWSLIHGERNQVKMLCYSDFAELCDNRAGVRAVAHAVGLNPLPVLIPCHLVVPKEAIDRIREIRQRAESTIFKGEDLCLNSILNEPGIDFGEYSLGKELKRQLITLDLK